MLLHVKWYAHRTHFVFIKTMKQQIKYSYDGKRWILVNRRIYSILASQDICDRGESSGGIVTIHNIRKQRSCLIPSPSINNRVTRDVTVHVAQRSKVGILSVAMKVKTSRSVRERWPTAYEESRCSFAVQTVLALFADPRNFPHYVHSSRSF